MLSFFGRTLPPAPSITTRHERNKYQGIFLWWVWGLLHPLMDMPSGSARQDVGECAQAVVYAVTEVFPPHNGISMACRGECLYGQEAGGVSGAGGLSPCFTHENWKRLAK